MSQQLKRARAGSVSFASNAAPAARSFRGVKRSSATSTTAAKALVSMVDKMGEWKFVDTSIANTNVSTTPQVTLLNGLAPGTNGSQRIGRKVRFHTIELKLFSVSDATTTYNIVRYALVLDKQANGAAPAFTDIYDAATPTALRNISNKERFSVLWDSGLIKLVGNLTGTISTQQLSEASAQVHEAYKKWSWSTQYNAGTAGTVADIATNAVYFVAIGSQVSGTGDSVVSGQIRLRYTDE